MKRIQKFGVAGRSSTGKAPQTGMSLIELMISLVIGSLILGAMTFVFFQSRTSYTYNETMSRNQENARIALDALSHDIRMAGFVGCGKTDSIQIDVIAKKPPLKKFTSDDVLRGFIHDGEEDVVTGPNVEGSDVLVMFRGSGQTVTLSGSLELKSSDIELESNPDGIAAGDAVLITDCEVGDLFRASKVEGDGPFIIGHGAAENTSGDLEKTYGPDAQVMRFMNIAFFIRRTERSNSSGGPIFALFRQVNGVDEEVVDGVADLRFFYALDGDRTDFVSAAEVGDWGRVVAVRVHLWMSTQEEVLSEAQASSFFERDITDRVYRQEFSQVIALRNMLK